MRIEIEVPDWVLEEERRIDIFAGIEPVAYKYPWDDFWYVKTSRCSQCGECCRKVGCNNLDDENRCALGVDRPWHCCVSYPRGESVPTCTVKYKKVKAK